MQETLLNDLIPRADLTEMIADGYVRVQYHPSANLAILNYTEKTQYEGAWNDVTRACRGLIYNIGTNEVVARGFDKFFNHGQAGAPIIGMETPVVVTDKMDGSLGIIYPFRGTYAVATRGSFTSTQAMHATQVLNTRYRNFRPPADVTALVEIIYPANRIVLDYAGLDDLVLLGGQPISGGRAIPPASMRTLCNWAGPVTDTMDAFTFAEALALEPRPNAEGIVVHDLLHGNMVKIKQADYVALHRIVTGLNERTVWECLAGDEPALARLIASLPDEFHDWVRQVAARLSCEAEAITGDVLGELDRACRQVFETPGHAVNQLGPIDRDRRKAFAAAISDYPLKGLVFTALDNRRIRDKVWQMIRPGAVTPSGREYTEATA